MRRVSFSGLTAAVLALLTVVLYLWLIAHQDTPSDGRVTVVASIIVAASALAIVGSLPDRRGRVVLLGAASALLFVMGLLGIFSIGLPLLIASGFALGGAARARPIVGP